MVRKLEGAMTAPFSKWAQPKGVILIRGDEVTPEPITWLWPGWLAAGKLHVLAGAPGTGKTTLAEAFAAAVSTGGRWPDGSHAPQGNTLIWSGEDDPADTLVPRMLAMGADMTHIHFISGMQMSSADVVPFDPANHMSDLSDTVERIGNVRLLIVDPVVSAVTGDSHKNTEVRRALQPLVDFGNQHQCAVLGISHFSKGSNGKDPTERVVGSIAFGAVARVVMAAAKKKDGTGNESRILVRSKSNIGPDSGGFHYALHQVEVKPGLTASCVVWGGAIEGQARELLDDENDDEGGGQHEIADWLREVLRDGPLTAKQVKRLSDAQGFNWRAVQRAKQRAGIKSDREGFGSGATYQRQLIRDKNSHVCHARQPLERVIHGTHDEFDGNQREIIEL
jgi:putative DNA primase/helicase